MPSAFVEKWVGPLLSLVGIVATIWFAVTGDLGLYIHPRYTVFTLITAAAAAVAVVAAFALLPEKRAPAGDEHEHDHDQRVGHRRPALERLRRRAVPAAAGALVAVSAGAMLVLPPSSLDTTGFTSSDVRSAAVPAADGAPPQLAGGDTASFTVKDWAALLRQGATAATLAGNEADVVGFVAFDDEDPENVFYLVRLSITCCAVDAQPVGVPVHLPGWQDRFPADSWVSIRGSFAPNPSASSTVATVLQPVDATVVEPPDEPYVY